MIGLLLLAALAQEEALPRSIAWEGTPPYADPGASLPRFEVDLAAWAARPTGWLLITLGSRPGSGTRMNTGSDVDLDAGVSPAVDARVEFWEGHGAGVEATRISSSGTAIAQDAFIYHGVLFDAGRRVEADVGFSFVDVDYQYTVRPEGGLTLTGHLGAEIWTFSGRVQTSDSLPPLDTHRAFSSGFWLAGIEANYDVCPYAAVRALGAGGTERVHQNFFKVEGDLLLLPLSHFALSLGYRLHAIRFLQSTNRSDLKFGGPTLGVELSF